MFRIVLIISVLLPAFGRAQSDLGIKVGLNISDIVMTNYINPDVESDLKLKPGLHAGVFIRAMANERIGVGSELLYSNKGVMGNENINLHYITLPLILQYKLSNNIVAEVGPEPGYLFSARSKHGNVSSTYNNKFDLALNGGFRLDTPKLIFGIRYCAGMFSVRDPIDSAGPGGGETVKYQNRVLQLSMGYKILVAE